MTSSCDHVYVRSFLLQYCTSDKRKRRSVDEEINDGTGDYLYTKITVIDPEGNK